MARQPNFPTGPGLPDDAVDDRYGNPTRNHPDVNPLNAEQFGTKALFAFFVKSPELSVDDDEYDGPESDPFSVAYTNLPLVRVEDLRQNDVLYRPQKPANEIVVIADEDDTFSADSGSITVRRISAPENLEEITPAELTVTKEITEIPVDELAEKYTYFTPAQ